MILKNKKFYLISLGCRANIAESEQIINKIKQVGGIVTDSIEGAQIVIINSCCVTNKAMSKTKYFVNHAKKNKSLEFLCVCGCYGQLQPQTLLDLGVDLVIGNKNKENILELISKVNKPTSIVSDISKENKIEFCNHSVPTNHTRAYMKIQDGCNFKCSYCIIPIVRGKQRSESKKNILTNIKKLASKGINEIVLTGVNTSGYYDIKTKTNFLGLLTAINKLPGKFRIRISSLEPFQINKKLIELVCKNKDRFCQNFHLCIQNACNSVLKRMNRMYTFEQFVELCEYIRKLNPLATITTDYIVGFIDETEKEFNESLKNLKKVKFNNIHLFPYSLHSSTPSSLLEKKVSDSERSQRFKKIDLLQNKIKNQLLKKYLNKTVNVLFEKPENNNQVGYSEYYFKVLLKSKTNLQNKLLPIKIIKINNDGIYGKYINKI